MKKEMTHTLLSIALRRISPVCFADCIAVGFLNDGEFEALNHDSLEIVERIRSILERFVRHDEFFACSYIPHLQVNVLIEELAALRVISSVDFYDNHLILTIHNHETSTKE